MDDISILQETYERDKRRCMYFGQLLFIHGLFTAAWFILMILLKLSKSNVEDLVFVLMLVAAYIMGYFYKNLKKKVKNSWSAYNKEKNRVSKLQKQKLNDNDGVKAIVD